ncbi:MAG: glycosyltransferase family 4 protein [Leptolyngbya sp. SIO4C1]|nr:glycosyltransferase family 4 protein [Leptolyngbya sp. SIO4C1]
MQACSSLRLLFISTPVGPLGSGLGGGVELTIVNLVKALRQRGHEIAIAAPAGSQIEPAKLIPIAGQLQPTAQTQQREAAIELPIDAVLANLCRYAQQVQSDYDLIVNFAYDWLPFFLTPFFSTPVAHFVSMGSLSTAIDRVLLQTAQQYPGSLGAYTQAQVETFPIKAGWEILSSAVDLSQYQYCDVPENSLAWMGRLSPEKGLEDAVAAAQRAQMPLKILGKLEDPTYWAQIQADYPHAPVEYLGFLSTSELQSVLRQCRALLMTPRWTEAFGNVAIEALACGVPVIAYRRGGPAEIVQAGKTGWLVEPDSVTGLVSAIEALDQIDRRACRAQAEQSYSLPALGKRFESWFQRILRAHQQA